MLKSDMRYRFVIDLASLKIKRSLAAQSARPPAVLLHRVSGGRPDLGGLRNRANLSLWLTIPALKKP